jgi:hypothetical protein
VGLIFFFFEDLPELKHASVIALTKATCTCGPDYLSGARRVCSRMLTYAHVCSRMLTYAGVQVGLIIFLGHDELYFLLTNPLYLLLFLLIAGGAAVYYFQQVTAPALVDCVIALTKAT